MKRSIHILPPALANQIAAGEVVQRPANVVKELMENALDSGATRIELVLTGAGKDGIQVIDNGAGIPSDEISLAFQRHATSKIRETEDLFAIQTMGFRGEALASIAAISKITVISRTEEDALAVFMQLDAGEVVESRPETASVGTSITVRNLFYNVPARRKFLKSDRVELKHIYEAFHRIALAYPQIQFELTSDRQKVFHLEPQSSRQRIAQIFGKVYHERLAPVEEQTDPLHLSGFILKPEHARKTRGEQYLFVNGRFIKHYAIDRAIARVFQSLLPEGSFPGYFLFLEVAPEFIDINIHPTKTEIKFEDEHTISAIVASAVKKSIGQFNLSSGINFDIDPELDAIQYTPPTAPIQPPRITVDENYNPFAPSNNSGSSESSSAFAAPSKPSTRGWEKLYGPDELELATEPSTQGQWIVPLYGKFIVTKVASGMVFIHHQRAQEQVRYHQMLAQLERNELSSQLLLFPEPLSLTRHQSNWLMENRELIESRGFIFAQDDAEWSLQSVPGVQMPWSKILPDLLDTWMEHEQDSWNIHLAEQYARSVRVSSMPTSTEVLLDLVGQLFALAEPTATWDGRRILITLGSDELEQKFK